MNTKTSPRQELAKQLDPRLGLAEDELYARTLRILAEALKAIEGNQFEGNLHFAAAAVGFAMAGCVEAAAQSTRQLLAPVRIEPPAVAPLPGQLLEAIAQLSRHKRPLDGR